MLVFLLFILGLAIGSFLNVLIDRIPQGQSPLAGRSYCDKCKKTLKWYDLVPLISYLYLKGKCKYCRVHISFYYPLVELITGVMFVLIFLYLSNLRLLNLEFGNYLMFGILNLEIILSYLYYLFILSSFIVIFFTDLKYGIIPDKIIYPAIIISIFLLFFISKESWLSFPLQPATFEMFVNKFLSGLASFAFFLILYLITRGKGMGFGDVKLAFLLGIILGFPKIIVAFYLAFLTGAIVGFILIIWGKKKLKGGTIPFGPFLIIGAVLSIFFGEKIIHLVSPWLSF